jgi:hypothetical protein
MAHVACNVSELSNNDQLEKGAEVIQKSTGNPHVASAADELAALVTAQAAYAAANAAYDAWETTREELKAARDTAKRAWMGAFGAYAGVVQAVTGGVAEWILSTGLGVRRKPTPPQPLPAPTNVRVVTNGTPGHSTISCDPLPDAKAYIVQKTTDPDAEGGWVTVANPTKATCDTNGVTPGTKVWYRICGVNPKGQGPWSEPAARPLM